MTTARRPNAFIMDLPLQRIFQSKDGSHAFYDIICWEYLLRVNFTLDDHRVFNHNDNYPYAVFEIHDVNSSNGLTVLNNLIDRWCFPTNGFLEDVLKKLCYLVSYALQWTDRNVHKHPDWFGDSEFDTRGAKHAEFLANLWKIIKINNFTAGDEKDGGFKDWSAFAGEWKPSFMKEHFANKGEKNERTTALMFGWRPSGKHTPDQKNASLCHELYRFLRGFNTKCLDVTADIAEHEAYFQKVMGTSKPEIRLFSITDLWRFSEAQELGKHGIRKAPRYVPLVLKDSEDAMTVMIDSNMAKREFSAEQWREFLNLLWLSGYDKRAIVDAVKKKAQGIRIKDEKDLIFWLAQEPNPVFTKRITGSGPNAGKITFLGWDEHPDYGNFVPTCNWKYIREQMDLTLFPFTVSREVPVPSPAEKIDAALVVSDRHAQPAGVEVDASKASIEKKEEEKESSTAMLVGIAAFALGFFALSR